VVLLFCAAVMMAMLPWLVRNLMWTGNPIYPYLRDVFGGPPGGRDLAIDLEAYGVLSGGWIRWLWSTVAALGGRTIDPLREAGVLGPLWLMLLPVAALIRPGERRQRLGIWIVVVTGLLGWGALVQYARFALPVLVPAAALAGASAAALTGSRSTTVRIAFRVLLVGVLFWNATVIATPLNLDRLAEVAGRTTREQFLSRWVSYAEAIEPVARMQGARLLLVGEARSLYLPGAVFIEDPYRVPWLVELSAGCRTPDELAARVRRLGATHILMNLQEMPRLARERGADEYWQDAGTEQLAVIRSFLSSTVTPVFQSNWLTLAEVPER
jgi:hypothetical protein